MSALLNGEELVLGTCYYPEHWPETLWKEDLERMLEAGIRVIRIAEFAWSKVEPTEGKFTYEFFDRFLDLVEETDMKVIFCTPTATPPAWLTEKYPEVLNANVDGVLYRHGARRHYNYNSPVYQRLSARITEKFAEHYAKRSSIIGWQLDNELNCEVNEFYSESDTAAFRVFLKEKYGTLEALNEAWGTVFWNQTYTDWEQVYVPRTTIHGTVNPHQVLDYTRFISESCLKFAKIQSDIIRKYSKPGDFITTNGLFGNLDYQKMAAESLDFMMYDSYPNFAYCLNAYTGEDGDLRDRKWSRNLTEVRAISPIFGIMEQQSGANGWNTRMEAPTPRPGQLTLWTMQSIAHGADFVSYFRWRTCTMGTEIYWHGILDYSGRENRRLREVREVSGKLQGMQEAAGALYEAKVGILKDYDNIWDAQLDVWHQRVEGASQQALFAAAQRTHTPMDFVYLTEKTTPEELQRYPVLFYPHMTMVSPEQADLLKAYVSAGGTLVIGCRSGYKDRTGKCVMEKLPGLLRELTGTDIPEYSFIAPDAGKVTIDWDGTRLEAAVFTDLLEAVGEKAEVQAVYTSDYYAGAGALVCNSYGAGKAYYYGTAFTEEAAKVFLEKLGAASPYADLVEVPQSCEIAVRRKGEDRYLFILNYEKHPAEIFLKKEGRNLYTQEMVSGALLLEGYGTLAIKMVP
ncbi:MAG: beta-galactosidase [Candidatus Limivivens sp.]|nr:beta-galactosidase [Candidatus Limivivens sp.]